MYGGLEHSTCFLVLVKLSPSSPASRERERENGSSEMVRYPPATAGEDVERESARNGRRLCEGGLVSGFRVTKASWDG